MHIIRRVKRMVVGGKQPQLTCSSSAEAPRLALEDVETKMNMGQYNGLFKDHTSPDRLSNGLQNMQSSPVLPTGRLSTSALRKEHGCWNQIK
jgi:hypothetical protein